MTTETTRYVVQYQSVYIKPDNDWKDYESDCVSIPAALKLVNALETANPNVRLIKRITIETVIEL